jgi:enediyne biosynthesis protein E4
VSRGALLALASCAALGGCGGSEPEAPPGAPLAAQRSEGPAPGGFVFVDVAREAGLDRPTWCGRPEKPHILESGGTGLALLDYDGDGDLDLYLVNGWRLEGAAVVERGRNRLYRNRGDGTFEDVSAGSGADDDGWGTGVGVGDADGDGRPDLFVANFGPDALYLNNGDGTFRRAQDSGAAGVDGWSATPVFFDADGDGDEDLFVSAYIHATLDDVLHAEPTLTWKGLAVMFGPFGLEGEGNRYFENLGGGRFREATREKGLEDVGLYYSFGAAALDLDGDDDLDLYVANDSNPNYLYRNDGSGRFQDVGLWSGCALDANGQAQAGMGIATGDFDGDGRPDLLVTHFADDSSTLYRNLGDCLFADVSVRYGVHRPTYGPLSWGTCLEDLDLDGRLDLFIANGHIYPQADRVEGLGYAQANQLLAWSGDAFRDVSAQAGPGLSVKASSRGLASGDLDGDGDVDLVIANVDAPPTLLRNDSPRRGAWLLIDAPGAVRVTVTAAGRTFVRYAVRGGSFASASDPRMHFGLGPVGRAEEVRVRWADGRETVLRDVEVGRVVHVARSG